MMTSRFGDAAANVGLGLVGRRVALLNFKRDFVGAAVLGALERANRAGDARIKIGAGAGDDARGKSGRVEFVLGIENERDLHGVRPLRAGRAAVQQMQKMRGDRFARRRRPRCACRCGQSGASREASRAARPAARRQSRARLRWLCSSASGRTQPSTETPVRSTSMGCACAGSSSSACFDCVGQAAQAEQACFVGGQFGSVGQLAVDQQVRHFFKLAMRGQVGDVVAAIVQVVAALAHGADGGLPAACRRARQIFWA